MKKLFSLFVALVFCFALSMPAFATSDTEDVVDMSSAYISFSEQLYSMGISAQTCLEDFVDGYNEVSCGSIREYIDRMIQNEVADAATLAASVAINEQKAAEYYEEHGYDPNVQTRASISPKWYDNIGTTSPKLPQAASYGRYKLTSLIQKGDVVSETEGLVAQVTGHIAIVEGKYWDSTYKQYYIRTLEANLDGVVHGVLDDNRFDERGVNVYYAHNASTTVRDSAVSFCAGQLGKPYALDIPAATHCNYLSTTANWYCSELVWAAYYNQGINFNGNSIPVNIYMPATLASSSKLTYRNVT